MKKALVSDNCGDDGREGTKGKCNVVLVYLDEKL